ncbi:general odorant-binding protein 69a-like [Diabrotica undecimpunctata]|uniref:general odorant-binding protein 69a-like n=1 Tax=Diabrotica undecimpunctata TaxID=50387 RepID=UPI003B63A42F
MKTFIVLGFLFYGAMALTEEQQQLMNSLHAECVSQTGVGEDVIEKAKSGDFVEDPKLKCYMKCVFDEIGVITDDGKIDVEGALAILPDDMKDIATPVITKCGTQAGADVCEAIFNTLKCYYDMDKRAFFLP